MLLYTYPHTTGGMLYYSSSMSAASKACQPMSAASKACQPTCYWITPVACQQLVKHVSLYVWPHILSMPPTSRRYWSDAAVSS